jgi:5-hydroxyisourate hydrolase
VVGYLTTHALDLVAGRPAGGMALTVSMMRGTAWHLLVETVTNADGRTDSPLLQGESFGPGTYQIDFDVGSYFKSQAAGASRPFLDIVPLRFGVEDAGGHYHVPLLVTPWSYATYRGS